VRYHKKIEKRLDKREDRALHVARLDQKIKSEILERLKKGTYGDIYNFDQEQFDSILDEAEIPIEEENEFEDEFIGEVDNENDYGLLDEDNPFGVNEEDLNNYLDNEGDEGDDNEDHFQPNDIDELDKLFKSYSEKDLKPSNNNTSNDKGNKKKGYIEIEMEKEDQGEYIKK